MTIFKTILSGTLLWSSIGYAQQAPRLSCTTSTTAAVIDTSYALSEIEGGYRLYVEYSSGAIPIEADPSTTVRLRDLDNLNERAKLFSRLPNKFTFDFKTDQCLFKNQNAQLSWHCFTRDPGSIGDLNFKSLSFFMYSEKSESFYGVSQKYNMGLEFQMSYEEFLGRDRYKKMFEEGSAEIRENLEFRKKYESVLRSAVVTFENTSEHTTCQIPGHSPKVL